MGRLFDDETAQSAVERPDSDVGAGGGPLSSGFLESLFAAEQRATDLVSKLVDDCPKTKLALVGYGQEMRRRDDAAQAEDLTEASRCRTPEILIT